jgi:translation initiation factor 2 beta subunit (eIF-2beta)/eIF-5
MDYDDMLDRAVSDTPDVTATDERLDLPEPEARQEGNVTVVENFQAIRDAITDGHATTAADIGKLVSAGTGCGSCVPELNKILRQTAPADSDAA